VAASNEEEEDEEANNTEDNDDSMTSVHLEEDDEEEAKQLAGSEAPTDCAGLLKFECVVRHVVEVLQGSFAA
jgi:hypothetical protein